MEKRAILGFILQNPTVSGKKLEFTMRKPFDAVLELATCPTGLGGGTRTHNLRVNSALLHQLSPDELRCRDPDFTSGLPKTLELRGQDSNLQPSP